MSAKELKIKPRVMRRIRKEAPMVGWDLTELANWFCGTFPGLSREVTLSELVEAARESGVAVHGAQVLTRSKERVR